MAKSPTNKKLKRPQKSKETPKTSSNLNSTLESKSPYFYVAVISGVLTLIFALVLGSFGVKQNFNLLTKCKDRESETKCQKMAAAGHCIASPGWMHVMCAASCNACEMLDYDTRCNKERLNLTMEPAFENNKMDEFFEKLGERFEEYNISYLSRPPEGAYVVQFDNFLSNDEINALLNNVGMLKRSTDQGKFDQNGVQSQIVSQGRTSENAWCMPNCESHPLIKNVLYRISNLTTVPVANFEAFQMLRYEIGQEYLKHHDMTKETARRLAGPRILTFFMYLSDVEQGGGTHFPLLNLTMMPKKGSAILWPSVLNEDVYEQHPLTFHQALPVEKGTKYAANSWIHLHDFRTPNFYGCTGNFDV